VDGDTDGFIPISPFTTTFEASYFTGNTSYRLMTRFIGSIWRKLFRSTLPLEFTPFNKVAAQRHVARNMGCSRPGRTDGLLDFPPSFSNRDALSLVSRIARYDTIHKGQQIPNLVIPIVVLPG
jgi:hypothetical protein